MVASHVFTRKRGRGDPGIWGDRVGTVTRMFKGVIHVDWTGTGDAAWMSDHLELARDDAVEVLGEDYFA